MALGGMIPFAFMLILRPNLADYLGGPQRANIFWAALGLTGAGAGYMGFQQHQFLDQLSHKYFGNLSDDQVRKYRALYESDMRY